MDQQFHEPDPVTGFLLRQSRCFPWTKNSKRWDRHKVVFDGELLSTYRVHRSKRVDSVQASDILNVEGLLLVSSSVPVVPPGARAEAPAGEPTPAGFLVNIRGGQEILFCASNEKDRARWIEGFSPQAQARRRSQSALGSTPLEEDSTDNLTDDQENRFGTLAPMNPLVKTGCGEDKGKGQNLSPPVPPGNGSTDDKGKGKGPPLPPGKGATESKGKHKGPPLPPGKGVTDKGKSKGPPLPSKGPPLPKGKMGPNKGGNGKGPPPPKAKGKGAGKGPPLGSKGKAGRGKGKGSMGRKDSLETDAPKAPKVHGLQEKKLSDAEGTIFAAPRRAMTLNFEALEPAAKPAPGKRWVPPSERGGKSGEAEVKVFDTAIAFRIGVATVSMDLDALAEAAASMDINKGVFKEKLDSADIFCTLLNELKFADPLGQLRAYVLRGGKVDSLREVERRLLKLCLVPRAMQRLRLLMMAATLHERTNSLRKQMNCLLTTAEGIQASAHLRDVVHVMQEFMAWNSGGTSTSEAPKAFHIGELLGKLKEIRTPGMAKNRNLIHWIIETLQEWERPIAANQLQSEVPSLAVAAKTNPVHMNEEMKAITECRQLAKNEFKEHRDDYLIGSIPLPSPAPPPAPKSPVRPKGHEPQASLEEKPDVPQNATSDLDAKETVVEVVEAVTEAKEETKPEVAPTVFFSLDESVEGRPTILPKDRFKVPVPTSAWDVSLLPTEVHVPRLDLYKAGTFAHVVPQATGNFGNFGSSVRGSMSSIGTLSRGAMWRQGFVWILRPTRKRRPEWVRCWADIRAHHLIIRYLRRKGAVRSESIIALPGAEIKPFHYLTATSIGQWLAKLKFHGFEIKPNYAHDKEPILIHVGNEDSAEHWFDELSRESALSGVGTLRRDAKKEVLWCTLDLEEKKLFCHADTVQFILGKPPKYEHDVGAATVRSFSDPDALLSKFAQKYRIGHPFGFEIEVEDWMSSQCSFFTTETSRDLDRWLSVLQAAPQSVTRLDGGHSIGMALPPVGEVDGDDAGLESLLAGGAARPSFGISFSRSVNEKTLILPIRSTNEEPEMEVNEDILPEGGDRSLMPQVPRPGRESRVSRVSMAVRDIPNILGGKDSDSDEDNDASVASPHVPAEEAEDGYATPDDEPETLGNLRRLARSLEAETAKLQNEVKAAECCAQLALAFFDETREGPSLESLHHLFVQLDQFAGEFKSAFATLRAAAARAKTTSRKTCRRSTL